MITLAFFAKNKIRNENQSNNVATLMKAIRTFGKASKTEVVRFHKSNGDSLQVLWDMAREKVGAESFEDKAIVVIQKINKSQSSFTETLPLYFQNIDRAALVKEIQSLGLVVTNPDKDDNHAILVKVGVSFNDLETTTEYAEYIKLI